MSAGGYQNTFSGAFFGLGRNVPFPANYGPSPTAVTVDVVEAGLLYAFLIVLISFIVILPGGKFKEQAFWFAKIVVVLFIGCSIMMCNFGMDWEVGTIESVETQYKSGVKSEIHARISLHIGLRGINITLANTTELSDELKNERIDYNERYEWNHPSWTQGRTGFGPFSSSFNQHYRESQLRGTPYPILWVAEYFTIDGEGLRWGRFYKQAGFVTHALLWLALPLWILTIILTLMILRYGALALTVLGLDLVLANMVYATVRNPLQLEVPISAEHKLEMHWGWCFFLNLTVGLACIIMGVVGILLDMFYPTVLPMLLGVDLLQDTQDTIIAQQGLLQALHESKRTMKTSVPNDAASTANGNGAVFDNAAYNDGEITQIGNADDNAAENTHHYEAADDGENWSDDADDEITYTAHVVTRAGDRKSRIAARLERRSVGFSNKFQKPRTGSRKQPGKSILMRRSDDDDDYANHERGVVDIEQRASGEYNNNNRTTVNFVNDGVEEAEVKIVVPPLPTRASPSGHSKTTDF